MLSRWSDSPIAALPVVKPKVAQSQDNNVGPLYSDTLSPPSWVSQPASASCSTIFSTVSSPSNQDLAGVNQLEEFLMGKVYAHLAAITHSSDVEVVTWDRLSAACSSSSQYQLLHKTVQQGVPDSSQDWDLQIREFYRHRQSLTTLGNIVLLYDRPVIPSSLRQEIMETPPCWSPRL